MTHLTAKMLSFLKKEYEYKTTDTVSFNTLLIGN